MVVTELYHNGLSNDWVENDATSTDNSFTQLTIWAITTEGCGVKKEIIFCFELRTFYHIYTLKER